jgi:putative two-component system response regulator
MRQTETLEATVRERTQELHAQTEALEAARLETLQRLAAAGEFRDEDTYQHTQRVGAISAALARAYGCDPDFVELIRLAAPLHDLGKIAVPDRILRKQGALTESEWEQIKRHPAAGAAILAGSTSRVLRLAEEIAFTHHECWNGSGYPVGAHGQQIPLSGRIVALADTFDALTSSRPYKPACPTHEALKEIERLSEHRFDPTLVMAFRTLDPEQVTRKPALPASTQRPTPTQAHRHADQPHRRRRGRSRTSRRR